MKIYFNGDSNTAGTELQFPKTQGFAAKLSDKLQANSFINEAVHGASNSLILRKINFYLDQCKKVNDYPNLIVVGWSDCRREDWFVGGKYCSMSSVGLQEPELVDRVAYDYWEKHIHNDMSFMHQMGKFYNRAIHNLHLELSLLKIPHIFFNAIFPLNYCETEESLSDYFKDSPILKLDWHDCYYHPYEAFYAWRLWALSNNYRQITPGMFHFEESCQESWAQIIFEYIKEKKII